ncbi:MAG: hypothetical protein ABEJ98_05695, partial [Candidatus Nanohaloarchaea archaeon]
MQIPTNRLKFREEVGIGGAVVKVATVDSVRLTFSNGEDFETVDMPIYVSKYSGKNNQDVVDNL